MGTLTILNFSEREIKGEGRINEGDDTLMVIIHSKLTKDSPIAHPILYYKYTIVLHQ